MSSIDTNFYNFNIRKTSVKFSPLIPNQWAFSFRNALKPLHLLHRLNCIQLDDEEAQCLQGYLTLILEERHHNQTSGTNGIVLEMGDEEFQDFAYHLGSDRTSLFRVLVENGNSETQASKLAILSDNGIRLFHVQVQSAKSLLHKSVTEG